LAAFVVVVAFLVRAVVLTLTDLTWDLPAWLTDLSSSDKGRASAAAGLAAAALALICLVLVWRLATFGGQGRGDVLVGEGEHAILVRAAALEHLLGNAIGRDVAELREVRVRLRRSDEGYGVSVAGVVGPTDLVGVYDRVREVSRRELERAAGLEIVTVDLDVDGFSR
jgi:hypothetical protein